MTYSKENNEPETIKCFTCDGSGYMVVYDPGHYYPDTISPEDLPDDVKCTVCNGVGEVSNPRLSAERILKE